MPIEVRNEVSGGISGPIATAYGATQKAERDRAFAAQIAEANAKLQQQQIALQLGAIDSWRDDERDFIEMGLNNQLNHQGQADRRAGSLRDDQHRQRQEQRLWQSELLGDARERDFANVDDMRARDEDSIQAESSYRNQQAILQQRDEEQMRKMRQEQGQPAVQPLQQFELQEMQQLQRSLAEVDRNPTLNQAERMQAANQINSRLHPLQQRQQHAEAFSRQNEEQEVQRQIRMRTIQRTNRNTGRVEEIYYDPRGIPHNLDEQSGGGGASGSSTRSSTRSGTQANSPIPGLPGFTMAQAISMMDGIRGETTTNTDGIESPRFGTESAVQAEFRRRTQSLQGAIGGQAPAEDTVTPRIQSLLQSFNSSVPPDVRGMEQLGQLHSLVGQVQDLSQQTHGFTEMPPEIAQRLRQTMQQIRQLSPETHERIASVPAGGQQQTPTQQVPPGLQQELPWDGRPGLQQELPWDGRPGLQQELQQPQMSPQSMPRQGPQGGPVPDTIRRLQEMRDANAQDAADLPRTMESLRGGSPAFDYNRAAQRTRDEVAQRVTAQVEQHLRQQGRRPAASTPAQQQQQAPDQAIVDQIMQRASQNPTARSAVDAGIASSAAITIIRDATQAGGRIDLDSLPAARRADFERQIEAIRRVDPQAAAAILERYTARRQTPR